LRDVSSLAIRPSSASAIERVLPDGIDDKRDMPRLGKKGHVENPVTLDD